MGEKRDTTPSGDDADLEREIRAGRKFSLSEAIGRAAGGGVMKGASPVGRNRQAELVIEECLRCHLTDAGGVLGRVVLRHVAVSDPLLGDHDDPVLALADYVRRVVGSEPLLQEVVRDADVDWCGCSKSDPISNDRERSPIPTIPTRSNQFVSLCASCWRSWTARSGSSRTSFLLTYRLIFEESAPTNGALSL